LYKSIAERIDESWMHDEDAIKRIIAHDSCGEQCARDQLAKLKQDHPIVRTVAHVLRHLGPDYIPSFFINERLRAPAEPPQVARFAIDQRWPEQRRFTDAAEAATETPKSPERGFNAEITVTNGGLPAQKRKSNGRDYRQVDAPLVTEMRHLIEDRSARSPEDAARGLVGRAQGGGTDESKVKRLALHYRKTYPVEPVE
jgi:hypothetical protein